MQAAGGNRSPMLMVKKTTDVPVANGVGSDVAMETNGSGVTDDFVPVEASSDSIESFFKDST